MCQVLLSLLALSRIADCIVMMWSCWMRQGLILVFSGSLIFCLFVCLFVCLFLRLCCCCILYLWFLLAFSLLLFLPFLSPSVFSLSFSLLHSPPPPILGLFLLHYFSSVVSFSSFIPHCWSPLPLSFCIAGLLLLFHSSSLLSSSSFILHCWSLAPLSNVQF